MIKSFANDITEDIYHGTNSRYARSIPGHLHGKICRLLDQLDAITKVETMRVPPGNHLEKLQGKLAEYWSVRINEQLRIIFKWKGGNVHDVAIVDYH